MARVEIPITVLNSTTGLPVAGASITPSVRGSGAPATWWTAETGGTSSTAAITTDSAGRATAWFNRGTYNLAVTGTGVTPYTEPWDALPAGDGAFEIAQIADGTIPLAKLVAAVQQALVPTGVVMPFAGSTVPTGYFLCNGQAVNRVTNAALFAAIGTSYGVGDGSTTFNVPNLLGRVPVGRDATDTLFDVLGEVGGEKTHLNLSTESGMPSHTHLDTLSIASAGAHSHSPSAVHTYVPSSNNVFSSSSSNAGAQAVVGGIIVGASTVTSTDGAHAHSITGAVSAVGAANAAVAHNNIQPYQVVNYIIKAI